MGFIKPERFLLAIALLLPLPATASDFCAVYLNIVDSRGKPANAPVDLIDQDGRVEQSIIVHGKGTLCDMGFGAHTIRIGTDKCSGYVTIHGVSLVYGLPRTFTAVWDGCATSAEMITIPPSCMATFRVMSSEGVKQLREADAVQDGVAEKYRADGYGRFFLGVRNGTVKEFTFSAPGYVDQTVKVECQRFERIEKLVRLVPK